MVKSAFRKNLTTGLKAIGGAMLHYIVMVLFAFLVISIVGGVENVGPVAIFLLVVMLLVTGIVILGWIYRTLWKWK